MKKTLVSIILGCAAALVLVLSPGVASNVYGGLGSESVETVVENEYTSPISRADADVPLRYLHIIVGLNIPLLGILFGRLLYKKHKEEGGKLIRFTSFASTPGYHYLRGPDTKPAQTR